MAEYTLIPKSSVQQVLELNRVCKACQLEMTQAEREGDDMVRAIVAGGAMLRLRELMTDALMDDIMPLVGSQLGISCETGKQYPKGIVRDVVLAGLLAGARVIGGEIHIASGRLYLTKAYWERRFRELPGITDVQPPALGLPRATKLGDKEYAVVQGTLTFRRDGKLCKFERTGDNAITVIWNAGMGLDAIHGKAKKRLYKLAYEQVTGTHTTDELEPEEVAAIEGHVVSTEVVPDYSQQSPGDDIAADAEQHVHEQTPAAAPAAAQDDGRKAEFLAIMKDKRGEKALKAWVAHAAAAGVDIASEADAFWKEQQKQRTAA